MHIFVQKMDGSVEPFERVKLLNSLLSAGASSKVAEDITKHIEEEIAERKDIVSTQEIYSHAFEILKHFEKKPVAARYSLKRAILDLGPSGFPFEKFVASLLVNLGYKNVKNGVHLQGKCTSHEVDVYAEKDGKKIAAELKFHNTAGFKTDLKVALYVHARFSDLIKAEHTIDEGWLITNTRFTNNAKKYARCANLNLLGWDYPQGNSLSEIIEKASVHPITALTSINSNEKEMLIDNGFMLCKEVLEFTKEHGQLPVKVKNQKEVLAEIRELCAK